MRWEDERYVRVYTRDTSDWVALSWEARATFILLLRIADRAGIIVLGKKGQRGLAIMLHMPLEVLERSVMELCEDGCLKSDGVKIFIPNFTEAQETNSSDAQRKRDQRERARAKMMTDSGSWTMPVLNVDQLPTQVPDSSSEMSQNVTESHELSRTVTDGHEESQPVTLYCAVPAVPCCAVPNHPARENPREGVGDLRERMEAVFLKSKSAKMLWRTEHEDSLRKVVIEGEGEVLRRWAIALETSYPRCSTVRELVLNWDHYAAPQPGAKGSSPPGGRNPDHYRHGAPGEVEL